MAVSMHETQAHQSVSSIFIVGVSRSGTSLMRRILNRSDQIAISKENHFLGHLISSEGLRQKLSKYGDFSDDKSVRCFVDALYSGQLERSSKHRGMSAQWHWIVKTVDKQVFLQRLLESERSDRALFALMMELYASHKGRRIMGEKTPAHVRYVQTLMEWFPDSLVIHMLRDPRAIFVSDLRRRMQEANTTPYRQLRLFPPLLKLFILLQVTWAWADSVSRCLEYQQRYADRYHLLKFEDLVTEPEEQIRAICERIQVDFQGRMLEQAVVSKGFQVGAVGFDARAADRWRQHIGPWANAWFVLLFRAQLREFGYTRKHTELNSEGHRWI
jgi:hypothetical protein